MFTPAALQVCEPLRAQDAKAARMLDDVAAKLGALFWQLNAAQLSPGVVSMLGELAAAVQNLDWQTAQQVRRSAAGAACPWAALQRGVRVSGMVTALGVAGRPLCSIA